MAHVEGNRVPTSHLIANLAYFQLFLSRFQFINEILFPPTEEKQKTLSKRKVRKD